MKIAATRLFYLFFLCLCLESGGGVPKACPAELTRPTKDSVPFSADAPEAFLENLDVATSMGQVVSTYDERLQTRVHFGLSEPGPGGVIPLVDPKAKAVAIYFHGSGTKKAGGRGFLAKMQALINVGVAPVAVDMPFHSEGPVDSQQYQLKFFMEWVDKLVELCAASKKPIYMVGHSFGPFVIQEYMARYPGKVKGALLISAAGNFHPALTYTYERITTPGMRFINQTLKDTEDNVLGGVWAGVVESQATWMTKPTPGRITFLRGTDDEWFPENRWLPARLGVAQPYGPRVVEEWLATRYPSARFEFAERVGHYIFDATNEGGRNLILQLLFDLMDIPEAERDAQTRVRTARELVAFQYYSSPIFRTWIGERYVHSLATEARAQAMLLGWRTAREDVWREIFTHIPERYPAFHRAREVSWTLLHPRIVNDGPRTRNPETGWHTDIQQYQSTFFRYLNAKQRGERIELGPDPMLPAPPVIAEKLFENGQAFRNGIAGPISREVFEASILQQGGTVLSVETSPTLPLSRITYRLPRAEAPELHAVVLSGLTRDEMHALLIEAYFDALRSNGWKPLAKNWAGRARGLNVKGTQVQNVIQTVELGWD